MINHILWHLTKYLRCKEITVDDKPYLERYYIGKLGKRTYYFHRFLAPDGQREMHNHPNKNCLSIILYGSYLEERVTTTPVGIDWKEPESSIFYFTGGLFYTKDYKLRTVKWLTTISSHIFHNIIKLNSKTVWTLFSFDEKFRNWGFLYPSISEDVKRFRVANKIDNNDIDKDWMYKAPYGKEINRPAP